MAQNVTLNGLRNQLLTTIFGRRLGLDPNDALAGAIDLRRPIESFSTAGTALLTYGVSVLSQAAASASTSWTLAGSKAPGITKEIVCASTGYHVVTSSVNIKAAAASGLSTGTIVTLRGVGAHISLFADSTASWVALSGLWPSSVTTYGSSIV